MSHRKKASEINEAAKSVTHVTRPVLIDSFARARMQNHMHNPSHASHPSPANFHVTH
jgi:hypothetical protein